MTEVINIDLTPEQYHTPEQLKKTVAQQLGIRDAVMFQNGNVLISSYGDDVSLYYAGGNTGTAQRTAIGQRADGTVIFIVTDGRSASSLGATHNDIIDMMVKYGAVNAAIDAVKALGGEKA